MKNHYCFRFNPIVILIHQIYVKTNFTLEKAKDAGKKKAIKDLERIGQPPYQNHKELLTERKWLSIYKGMIHNC